MLNYHWNSEKLPGTEDPVDSVILSRGCAVPEQSLRGGWVLPGAFRTRYSVFADSRDMAVFSAFMAAGYSCFREETNRCTHSLLTP
jgi:hypothetical protein